MSGIFINLYDENTLSLYLKNGIYGFLMKPVFVEKVSNRSRYYAILADYASCREGTHVFFFLKRKVYYGGTIIGSMNTASFYLNGDTSPLGRAMNAELVWDESSRYDRTKRNGVFIVKGKEKDDEKSQPFIIRFKIEENLTGKYISSDELYFELGKFPYPLPSNTINGMGFCTLTPGEVRIALELLNNSNNKFEILKDESVSINGKGKLMDIQLLKSIEYQNEAHLEFSLIADLSQIEKILPENDNYTICRQVPISPFKPFNMDRADICLYSKNSPIKEGTIPNIVIELKRNKANYKAYNQVTRYLKWLEKVTTNEEFDKINVIIIAPDFNINRDKIDFKYSQKIKMYSLNTKSLQEIV